MEEKSKRILPNLIYVTILAIIIITVITYSIYQPEVNRMTAKEGLTIANDIAKDYNSSARLISVYCPNFNINEDGSCFEWLYHYHVNYCPEPDEGLAALSVFVLWNGEYNEGLVGYDLPDLYNHTFENWTIDSDEALSIALEDNDIRSYVDTHDLMVRNYRLLIDYNYSTNPVWTIQWGNYDHDENLIVIINAITGKIITSEN